MIDKELSLKERIDHDAGFNSKRSLLIWVSILMLALNFAGASVKEANTFVLNLEFEQSNGLSVFILLAIVFLMVRYFSYAHIYQDELTKLWKEDFFRDPRIFAYNFESDSISGVLVQLAPEGFIDEYPNRGHPQLGKDWNWSYECKWFFRRYFCYERVDTTIGEVDFWKQENILFNSIQSYFLALRIELKHQAIGFMKYPENLDVKAPYFLGIAAILSFLFKTHLLIALDQLIG